MEGVLEHILNYIPKADRISTHIDDYYFSPSGESTPPFVPPEPAFDLSSVGFPEPTGTITINIDNDRDVKSEVDVVI